MNPHNINMKPVLTYDGGVMWVEDQGLNGFFDKIISSVVKNSPVGQGIETLQNDPNISDSAKAFADSAASTQDTFIQQAQDEKFKRLAQGIVQAGALVTGGTTIIPSLLKQQIASGYVPTQQELAALQQYEASISGGSLIDKFNALPADAKSVLYVTGALGGLLLLTAGLKALKVI